MFETDFGRWVQTDLFGGKGAVAVADLWGRREAPPFQALLACELAVGASVGAHYQESAHEVIVCLEGSGRAIVDGALNELTPGSVVYLRQGAKLALENLSDVSPLRYLIIKAR
jgi:quercetin dioxygenase-like cupin family protein